MKKALLIIGLLFLAGCDQQRVYLPPLNKPKLQREDNDLDPRDAAFIKNLEQGLAECEATSTRLYEEAQELNYCRWVVSNEQQQIYATLTNDQLATCQAYVESRRNYRLDPKTLVLRRAVKTSLSADEYAALVRIWMGLTKIEQRFEDIVAESKAGIDRRTRLREGGKLYLENLHADRSRLAEKSMELTDEIRQLNYDSHLQSIEQSLREMSRHQPPPTRPMGSVELYKRYEDEARQRNRDMDIGSIEQSLREIKSSLNAQRYGY